MTLRGGTVHIYCAVLVLCFRSMLALTWLPGQKNPSAIKRVDHLTGRQPAGAKIPAARVSVTPPALTTDGIRSSSDLTALSRFRRKGELLRQLTWIVRWRIGNLQDCIVAIVTRAVASFAATEA